MSIAIVHFLVGASIALWLLTFEPHPDRHDPVVWLLVGGIWAMIPDLNKFWPMLDLVHDNPVASTLFGLHYVLDVLDPADSLLMGVLAVLLFGLTTIVTNVHDLR